MGFAPIDLRIPKHGALSVKQAQPPRPTNAEATDLGLGDGTTRPLLLAAPAGARFLLLLRRNRMFRDLETDDRHGDASRVMSLCKALGLLSQTFLGCV